MMKKIKKGSMKFIIDEDSGVVVAYRKRCKYNVISKLNDMKLFEWGNSYFPNCLNLPDTIKAVARLHPDDTWDEKVGVKIAKEKFNIKYTSMFNKRVRLLNKYINRCLKIDNKYV